jgi:hypothetical protein
MSKPTISKISTIRGRLDLGHIHKQPDISFLELGVQRLFENGTGVAVQPTRRKDDRCVAVENLGRE